MTIKKIIAWDLGATKCAAGLIEYDDHSQHYYCKKRSVVKMADTSSLDDLIHQLEIGLDYTMCSADAICVSAAGFFNGECLLSSHSYRYTMPFAALAKKYHWPTYAVIHDYASVVCATFTSYMSDTLNVKRLNEAAIDLFGRRVAFGIGTGLGLKDGILFNHGDFWLGQNEVGHIGINTPSLMNPSRCQQHRELILFLQKKISQPITMETLLSGPGMLYLHEFFYPNLNINTPEQVGNRVAAGLANEVLDSFAWYLGVFVGTMQLCFMPSGGLWITGGVVLHHLNVFDQPSFQAGILASPAYREEREAYPLGVLCHPDHALIGSAYYAVKRLIKNDEPPLTKETVKGALSIG